MLREERAALTGRLARLKIVLGSELAGVRKALHQHA